MTSLQIEYFLKVAELMSFSQAAQALYVSQPSVSRQIQLLEKDLGYTLFDRSNKNALSLTAAGMLFREAFQQASTELEEAYSAARSLSSSKGLRLRLGVGTLWDFSDALCQFRDTVRQQYPQAELRFESDTFLNLRSRVRSGDLDAILCTKTSLMDFDGLDVELVANLESRAYVRKGLLRPEDQPLTFQDFQGQRLLMLTEQESPMAMEHARIQFLARQISVEPVWMENRDSILQALLMGDGIAVFDQHMRFADDPRLTWMSLEDQIPLCVVSLRSRHNPLVHVLAESLQGSIGYHHKNTAEP